jgi:alpha-beta hydrolase superfamily lysophospholipase
MCPRGSVRRVETVETDVLGQPYEQRRIDLPADDEGELLATLVTRRTGTPTRRAVLYVHGFIDYFFQTHLADFFVERGYDFYALDLRKYGRSLRPHQTPNFTTDLSEYFTEIDEAIRIIRDEDGHDTVLLNGHSTGGLIAALWAQHNRGRGLVQAVFLNSPFFEFNESWLVRKVLTPVLAGMGARNPKRRLPQQLTATYGQSIHRNYHGEWDYNLEWKPLMGFGIYAGWVRAISLGHQRVQRGLAIDVPILVACSSASYRGKYTEAAHDADSVLNVDHIVRYAAGLGRDVTVVRVPGGKHDLTLSRPKAREYLFTALDGWLKATLPAA